MSYWWFKRFRDRSIDSIMVLFLMNLIKEKPASSVMLLWLRIKVRKALFIDSISANCFPPISPILFQLKSREWSLPLNLLIKPFARAIAPSSEMQLCERFIYYKLTEW